MDSRLLRAAYTIEFLVSLIATFEFWSQVGGQNHLDLMPWWWKALLSVAIATAVVKLTAAGPRRQVLTWLLVLTALVIGCGVTTYYFHLYEPQDDAGDEDAVTPTLFERHTHLPGAVRYIHQ
jgi:hypothetical protein